LNEVPTIVTVSHARMRSWEVLAGSLVLTALLTGCTAGMSGRSAEEVTQGAYGRTKDTHAVVLMSVDWGRRWGFCAVENAQLRTFAFDRMPVQKHGEDEAADLLLEAPPSLLAGPGAVAHYALLVEPGEYALIFSELKVARSVNDVATYRAGRRKLIQDGKPLAGSFTAGSGELVYVGHFGLECVNGRLTLWRYYVQGREGFQHYLATNVRAKYPFLDTEKAQYKLFRTSMIGRDYELP
jgi:hypothetical protein